MSLMSRTRHFLSLISRFFAFRQEAARECLQASPDVKPEAAAKIERTPVPKPFYRYGVYHAADLAKRLGLARISVIEFGVAGGNGLLALEYHAADIEQLFGVGIDVYGFDTGEGLPRPLDHRDMPYRFAEGNYRMDVPALEARLERSKIVIGNVRHTASTFFHVYQPSPIGFAAFDMDYYSSTMDALRIFEDGLGDEFFLPRLQLYFDDINGSELSSYNDFVGELAAITDFNRNQAMVKIAENRALRSKKYEPWHSQMYVMHRFRHSDYGRYISTASAQSLGLKP